MQKSLWKRLLGLVLAGMLFASGGLVQQPVYAAEQTEPNAIEDEYTIDGVTYFNAYSKNFASSPQLFFKDLLTAEKNTELTSHCSEVGMWLWLAVCLDNGCPFVTYENVISAIDSADYGAQGKEVHQDYDIGQLEYLYNDGKDEFYIRVRMQGRLYYVIFRNLGVVALLPDANVKGNYVSSTVDNSSSGGSYVSDLRNDSNSYTTQTISDSESGTVSMSNSVNGSSSYSFTEGIKVGAEESFLCGKVTQEVSLSSSQAFSSGWSKSQTESQTFTKGTSSTRTVPPYSAAVMESGTSDIEATTRYNCPVGLTYSVDILTEGTSDWDPDKDPNATNWKGKKYTFGPDARKDIYQRWVVNGGDYNHKENLDREKIDWWNVTYRFFKSREMDDECLRKYISSMVPMSSAGAVLTERKKSTTTTFKNFVPLHPLRVIKIETPPDGTAISSTIDYDNYGYLQMKMPMGKSSFTKYFSLGGYNQQGGIYSNFNKDFGHWIVVDESGKELGEDAPVVLDSSTGKFTAVKPGTCKLKYLIDETSYTSVDTGDRYITNKDLSQTAEMEITVEEPAFQYKLKVEGSYVGVVGAEPENIEGDGKLEGMVLDSTGKEVDMDYIWDAQQPPSKGINLSEDGMVSFTKTRTFKVRIMTPDRKHYSDWVDIKAVEPAETKTVPIANNRFVNGPESGLMTDPDVVGDAEYSVADKGTILFVDGSFKGTANGEEVCIEGDGKLEVRAEDLTGDELLIRYEWEKMPGQEDGLELSKDGNAVFTKPGTYFVRVKSGERYSDWVEIKAFEPAVIKSAPTANNCFSDGTEVELVKNPGVEIDGKMAFAVLKDGDMVPPPEAYTEKLPVSTEPGTYYVWYKAIGDERHGDSPADHIEVVITDTDAYKAEIAYLEANAAKLKSVKAKKGGKAVVKWKRNTSADGYQLECSANKEFPMESTLTLLIDKANVTSAKLSWLGKGKKYYFRIRPFKIILDPVDGRGNDVFGKWSEIRKIKTK